MSKVAIVDYGLGNLFSVRNACEFVGLEPVVTQSAEEIFKAGVVILPGVGAFGDAMECLRRLDLISPLRDVAASGTPLVGICLGMQLLMNESSEFGKHEGLGVIPGSVVRFQDPVESNDQNSTSEPLKVPQVGWNRVYGPSSTDMPFRGSRDHWSGSLLDGLKEGDHFYFTHSFYVRPDDCGVILSLSRYGHIEFCSSLRARNVFAFQFHPERSGATGLTVYRNLARLAERTADHVNTHS